MVQGPKTKIEIARGALLLSKERNHSKGKLQVNEWLLIFQKEKKGIFIPSLQGC